MEVISYDSFETARMNWCKHKGLLYDETSHPDFNELFGINSVEVTWAPPYDGGTVKVSNKTARMVRLMTGPHWRTMIKVWEIRNDK